MYTARSAHATLRNHSIARRYSIECKERVKSAGASIWMEQTGWTAIVVWRVSLATHRTIADTASVTPSPLTLTTVSTTVQVASVSFTSRLKSDPTSQNPESFT